MKTVSILIPCYNEEQNIVPIYNALGSICDNNNYHWEILFVNDGSNDDTLKIIKQISDKDEKVKYISLSRNFGKENALLAGLDHTTGDCTIIIDADLQHPPHLINDMLQLWEEGYDDVYAQRLSRGKESWIRKKLTILYYSLLQKMAKIDILPNVGDFRLLDKKCVKALTQLRETQRYNKGLYCWIGFRKKKITFDQADRTQGKSSFNYYKLFNLAIEGITSYTTAPLRISTIAGFVVSLTAFIYMCYVLLKTILYGDPVQGYPTLIIVILFLGGIQLLSLGIIGEYLGRIFHETKNRPVYIIEEKKI
ncbi:MAG: glycosyltransferase family 2 protein [Prevotella sp.]|nr:glycosyltransferase family 2 protein [Prevotella sp.]